MKLLPRRLITAVVALTATHAIAHGYRHDTQNASDLFDLYRARQFDRVEHALDDVKDWQSLIKSIEAALPKWPKQAGAAFGLEVAIKAAHAGGRTAASRDYVAAVRLLRAAQRRLLTGERSDFELPWSLAALALIQGSGTEAPTHGGVRDIVERVRERLDDPRVRFSLAVRDEQEILSWLLIQGVEVMRLTSLNKANAVKASRFKMGEVAKQYSAIRNDPIVGAEATLRLGVMTLYRDEPAPSVELFQSVLEKTSDPFLRYLACLFHGQALTRLERYEQAAEMYRNALAIRPGTQSARVALASVLYIVDKRNEAAELGRAVLTAKVDDDDPWAWYAYGDFRHLRERVVAMREAMPRTEAIGSPPGNRLP